MAEKNLKIDRSAYKLDGYTKDLKTPEKKIKEQGTWMPSLKWMCKSFSVIMVVLVIAFFSLNFLLKPYMRDIPMEITPWLQKADNTDK